MLDHRTRRMIVNYITSHPGESFQRMRRVLDINSSTLRYHLDYLRKNRLVEEAKEYGQRCYYPCGSSTDENNEESHIPELNKRQNRILACIKKDPGITKREIARTTNLAPKEISKCIRVLRDNQLIWKVRSGRNTGYEFITDKKLKDEMMRLLIDRFLNEEISKEKFLALKKELEK